MKWSFQGNSFCDGMRTSYKESFQRGERTIFFLETKNVWEIMLRTTVPEAEEWQK